MLADADNVFIYIEVMIIVAKKTIKILNLCKKISMHIKIKRQYDILEKTLPNKFYYLRRADYGWFSLGLIQLPLHELFHLLNC